MIWNLVVLVLWVFLLFGRARQARASSTHPRKGMTMGMPLRVPVRFELHPERWYDGLFKALRLSREQQMEDHLFDRTVYVVCDHPGFQQLLQQDGALRTLVAELLLSGVSTIWGDGESVWIRRPGTPTPAPQDAARLEALTRGLAPLRGLLGHRGKDRFVARAWGVEAVATLFAAYFFVHALRWGRSAVPRELDVIALVDPAVKLGIGLWVAYLVVAALLLVGSSRGHRSLVGSLGVSLLVMPMVAFQGASDLNAALDTRPSSEVRCVVRGKDRRRYSKGVTEHELLLRDCEGEQARQVQRRMRVDLDLYTSAQEGETLVGLVRPGALGVPWFQSRWIAP